jgi:hypothetical protein
MSVVKILAFLDLEQNRTFFKGLIFYRENLFFKALSTNIDSNLRPAAQAFTDYPFSLNGIGGVAGHFTGLAVGDTAATGAKRRWNAGGEVSPAAKPVK